jgi:hypothetical protein
LLQQLVTGLSLLRSLLSVEFAQGRYFRLLLARLVLLVLVVVSEEVEVVCACTLASMYRNWSAATVLLC